MRDGGRIEAAIAVLADMEARHKPAHLALKAWGEGARYAGAKDRAFVSGLVLDVLRRRRSLAWMMGDESERTVALCALRRLWSWDLERIAAAAIEPHGPGALSLEEASRLAPEGDAGLWKMHIDLPSNSIWATVNDRPMLTEEVMAAISGGRADLLPKPEGRVAFEQLMAGAPEPVLGDYPDWLDPHLARVFGDDRAVEAEALAARAPVDLRVNTLKTDMAHVMKALEPFGPHLLTMSPNALRIPAPAANERAPPVESAPEFAKGWFEVQDAGSQLAAAEAGEIKGKQVLDFCAGGGGKTLALAAAMANSGQLYAYDSDARRLKETVTRSQRAGVRNLQVRSPIRADALAGLEGRMDLVFVDAPCTGSGTWRRHPDAKWRLTPEQLTRRMAEQDAILVAASEFVKPGGRLIYVTCSLFAEENEDRIATFLAGRDGFAVELPQADRWRTGSGYLRLTPASAGTDGFFVAALRRAA